MTYSHYIVIVIAKDKEKLTIKGGYMKLNKITETGFYKAVNDEKPNFIFEVIENTDDNWLKDEPNAKLLVDEWGYEYTDTDDRRHYETFGNLIQVQYADAIEVCKMSENFIVSEKPGIHLIEDKPTYKEQYKKLNLQLSSIKGLLTTCQKQLENVLRDNARLYARNAKLRSSVNYYKREAWSSQNEALTLRGEIYHNNLNNEEYIQKLIQELEIYKQSEQEAKEIIVELKFKNKKLKDIIENKFEEENITDTAVTYLNDQNIYLEKENKRLKEKNNILTRDFDKWTRLIEENEQLKEKIKKYSAINEQDTKDYAEIKKWLEEEQADNDKLQQAYQNDHCDLLACRSALKKIREVTKGLKQTKIPFCEIEEKIQNIISEVENERNN